MHPKQQIVVDDYANSMFVFENINTGWVSRCARYLTYVFGDAVKGATVVDYAFGRGNWSLAFREAGAEKVVAIDASASNVKKFSEYIAAHNICGIQVIEGNVLVKPIEVQVDILWVYGILQHIDTPEFFIRELVKMWKPNSKGLGLIYSYNAYSLRQVIVNLARRGVVFESYEAYRDDSFHFSHHARLRARDDLTAPHIFWHSLSDMAMMLSSAGASPDSCVESFSGFEKTENVEFKPHHILFRKKCTSHLPSVANILGVDEQIIYDLGDVILSKVSPTEAKKIALGITNAHFNALAHGGYEKALLEDFLYFLYCFKVLKLNFKNKLQESIIIMADQSLLAISQGIIPPELNHSVIARYLSNNPIRI